MPGQSPTRRTPDQPPTLDQSPTHYTPDPSPTRDTPDQSGSNRFQVLLEAALEDYAKKTGIILTKHPLAMELQSCDSIESITAVLHGQLRAFKEFRGSEKLLKSIKGTLSILAKLSATASLRDDFGLVRRKALTAFFTSLNVFVAFPTCDGYTHRHWCPAFRMHSSLLSTSVSS
jgi:hypothetical protein